MTDRDRSFIYRVVVCTLAVVIVAVVLFLLRGLVDSRIDNKDIFAILGPAFMTIIGCFVGLISGLYHSARGNPSGTE
jgi:hypothetical protein